MYFGLVEKFRMKNLEYEISSCQNSVDNWMSMWEIQEKGMGNKYRLRLIKEWVGQEV